MSTQKFLYRKQPIYTTLALSVLFTLLAFVCTWLYLHLDVDYSRLILGFSIISYLVACHMWIEFLILHGKCSYHLLLGANGISMQRGRRSLLLSWNEGLQVVVCSQSDPRIALYFGHVSKDMVLHGFSLRNKSMLQLKSRQGAITVYLPLLVDPKGFVKAISCFTNASQTTVG